MKRIALMFALLFAVAFIFPANAPAPCGNGIVQPEYNEECDPPGTPAEECGGEVCLSGCICPEIPEPYCGDKIVQSELGEECDPPGKVSEACDSAICLENCTCPEPPGTCEPRTQGFWKRVCDGVYGVKLMHPETPEDFADPGLCVDLMVRGNAFSLPCVRSASQIAALKLNSKYGMLDDSCKVYYDDREMTVKEVLDKIDELNDKDCKAAADLAEDINSGDAL